MIEKIMHKGNLLAIIVRKNFNKKGISFITPDDFYLQLGYMQHSKGHQIKPHMHHPVSRTTIGTKEVLIIQRGELRIDFYSSGKKYLKSRKLLAGDVILLASEGHGMTALKPIKMIEVKNGPFCPEKDKEKFEGKR